MKPKWSPTDHVGLPPCVQRRLASAALADPVRREQSHAARLHNFLDTLPESARFGQAVMSSAAWQTAYDIECEHSRKVGIENARLRGDLALLNQYHDEAIKENIRLDERVNGMAWVIHDLRRDSHGSVIGVYLDQNAALAMRGVWQSDHPDAPCPTIIGYGLKG